MSLANRHHRFIRWVSAVVTAASLTYVAQRAGVRADVTAEGLSQITSATRDLVKGIDTARPVVIHAYVSREVPSEFVTVRSRLLNVLRELEAVGGPGLTVRIVEPALFSEEAQEAIESHGIEPRPVVSREAGRVGESQIFLGLALVSGPNEEVIPFLDRGLSVEYELVRALRTVTREKKKVVGVLRTDATIMGNFDLQARRQQPAWRVIGELRKQYEVRSLSPEVAIPDDVDVLFVPQVASLTQPHLDIVRAYVDAGRPALLTVDPMPLFSLALSPSEPKPPPPGQNNMFGMQQPGEAKGDFVGFLSHVGVSWDPERIVLDTENPHPGFLDAPPHVVFVAKREDGVDPFGAKADPIVAGLNEVVVLFGGALAPSAGHEAEFSPLLETGKRSGYNDFDEMTERHILFGVQGPLVPSKRTMSSEPQVLAARITGAGASGEGAKARNAIVIADLDLFGDQFFAMHERGGDVDGDGLDDIRFDNVAFLLNAIDTLAGDEELVELRKRRALYRRLTSVDARTKDARERREKAIASANEKADGDLKAAQEALDAAVKAINDRGDLDETTKAVLLKSAEEAENRRLGAKREAIQREKAKQVARIETEHLREVDAVQNRIRLIAVLAPPIPALLMGALIFGRKRRREHDSIPSTRKRGAA
ncbi:MAG TPA: Gldg family protein [Nannocystaceae bacterium]|nr:Gldg family protein [Nannocystaceae bacterium]